MENSSTKQHVYVFTDEVIEQLFAKYSVNEEFKEIFSRKMILAESKWVSNQYGLKLTKVPTEEKYALKALSKASQKLKEQLENLSSDAWRRIANISEVTSSSPFDPQISYTETHCGEDIYFSTTFPEGSPIPSEIDLPTLLRIMELLEDIPTIEFFEEGSRRRGPKSDKALTDWMRNMYGLWTSIDKKFTIHFHENLDPISKAAEFCCETYGMLSPDTPKSRIRTEANKARTSGRD